MGIQPIGAVGTEPVVYNVRRITVPVRDKSEAANNVTDKTVQQLREQNSRRRFDTVDFSSNEEPPDFKAIALIKKSEIKLPEPPDLASSDKTQYVKNVQTSDYENTRASTEKADEQLAENSATVKSSDEIEKESTSSKLTPSQQQGVETYQRFQNYLEPLNMSNARVAV